MRKNIWWLLFNIIGAALYTQAQPFNIIEKKADSLFASWNTPNTPGFSIAVIKNGELLFSKGYGIANLEYDIPNHANTIFDIASLTKQFTAYAVATLAQAGQISLQDDVRRYIPELYNFGKTITLQHLLSHTSGLRDQNELLYLAGWKQEDIITNEDVLNLIFRQRSLNFSPGEQYKYCNSGYTLLALVVERVTHIPFNTWINEHIFTPLKMTHSSFLTTNQVIKNRANSYSSTEEGYSRNDLNSSAIGARGLQSTVQDISLWVLHLTKKTAGNESVIRIMNTPPSDSLSSYSFGQAFNTYNSIALIEHDGSDAGYRSYIGRFPDQESAVIVLGNLASINPKALAMQLADVLLFKRTVASVMQKADKKRIAIPEYVEKGMEGQFTIAADTILTIWADDHTLKAIINHEEKIYYLTPVSPTEFTVKDLLANIIYKKGTRQQPEAIIYQSPGKVATLPKVFIEDEETRQLLAYEGIYYSAELNVSYRIRKQHNKLEAALPRHTFISLKKQKEDYFTGSQYWFRKVKFIRNEAAQITGFELSTGRSYNIKFTRQNTPPVND